MKTILSLIFTILSYTAFATSLGSWNNYLSYYNIEQVEKAGKDIFVLASGGLYQYNTEDGSLFTYDKVRGLNDAYINHIAWNPSTRNLIAVYDNANIDFIEANGNVTNLSDLYNKVMTEDKTVNSIYVHDKYAYLATGFGVVKINMRNIEISESYVFGYPVNFVYIEGERIFASSQSNGLYSASLRANLQDKTVWQNVGGYVDKSKTINTELLAIVKDLKPGGPKNNNFYEIKFVNNKLYTTGGVYNVGVDKCNPGTIQILENDKEWTIYQDQLDSITGYMFWDNICIDVDPTNPSHVFAGGKSGLYEFMDGKLKAYYNKDNSPLDDAFDYGNNYLIVSSICFDKEGNLWVLNSLTDKKANLFCLKKDGTWENHYSSALMVNKDNFQLMRGAMFDSRGLLWFVNDHWDCPALICYNTSTKKIKVYNRFVNQDGTLIETTCVRCVAEDKEGNIWIGTNVGPLYLTPDAITSGSDVFTQFKVPRNDGTNYADYLLSNVDIKCITIDGAGRKWMGTGNGAYLISADNLTQEAFFHKDNSELLSDEINSIAINGANGEVFFATTKGLCSYISDATTPSTEMSKDNVYAYPNPVEPNYTGSISVVGLSMDADVKITTATGYLVYQGRSNGGSFTWNGCDMDGKRVASGIYNVITAKSDGSKGTVCKIAIIR